MSSNSIDLAWIQLCTSARSAYGSGAPCDAVTLPWGVANPSPPWEAVGSADAGSCQEAAGASGAAAHACCGAEEGVAPPSACP